LDPFDGTEATWKKPAHVYTVENSQSPEDSNSALETFLSFVYTNLPLGTSLGESLYMKTKT